ncbi:MAG: hypothetical protein A4E53_03940 [Pelotomaculum sp. PtaB.Bin104]|nr:MAG: hypothetical protein A4E53_03940 [Pelotomaculum sp. PtaB.Bin104]
MENARLLDERLRKIIGEVSHNTGGEIKKNLLQDFEASFNKALEKNLQKETIRILALLKSAIDKI